MSVLSKGVSKTGVRGKASPWLLWAVAVWVISAALLFGGPVGAEGTVTNFFQDTFITDALSDVAFEVGVNIVTDVSVQGFVTLELNDVPFEEALRLILLPGGYTYTQLDEKTYLVGAADPASPIFHLLSETRRYHFGYVNAESARRLIPAEYETYVKFDNDTNTAMIQASPELLQRIESDLRAIDAPPAQTMIEAMVIEVSTGVRDSLGIDWSWNNPQNNLPNSFVSFNGLTGSIGLVTAGGVDRFFSALRLLVEEGHAEIRANPRVAAIDGGEAHIFVGKQRYYRMVTGTDENPTTRMEAIDVGVSLNIRPRIADNGDITLFIEPDVSDVTGANHEGLPEINRRQVSTTVRVRDGETLTIGGLIQTREDEIITKVPLLGDLPIFSHLFRKTNIEKEETEVIVLITPHLM